MSLEWRNTLKTLTGQFQARASTSPGLHHLFTEVADHERDKLVGPHWFAPWSGGIRIVDGKPQFEKWSVSRSDGLPWISPGFREPMEGETFADNDSNVIRDKSGVVRAVSVPMKLRTGYYCGRPSDDASAFRSLADVAATALAGAKDLREHAFATDLTDLFRKPRGGIRYVFGDVPGAPNHFISHGWAAGVLQFDNGVLIDLPITESKPDADHWLVLLHRLGWHRIEGSGLQAQRWCWNKSVEVAWEMLHQDASQFPNGFSNHFNGVSSESFYSVIGTKDAPLDVNLASAFAIDLLLADLASQPSVPTSATSSSIDYSNEKWHRAPTPKIRATKVDDCESIFKPQIGVLVATKVEREALLKRMRPPKRKRSVIQTHVDSNTYFLGRLGTANIVACMTAMGSVGRDSSTLVTTDLIKNWDVRGVIMAGIAFGRDPSKQQIGNVLISEKIIPYEPERVGKDSNQSRGNEHVAGAILLNRFRNISGWVFKSPDGRDCDFQIGPILSGEKLVDNVEYRDGLFKRFSTAIGGEMEGTGVAASAERQKREWIVVKAICDWGDGTKTKIHQGFAAAASVSLVEHVLNQVGVLDSFDC